MRNEGTVRSPPAKLRACLRQRPSPPRANRIPWNAAVHAFDADMRPRLPGRQVIQGFLPSRGRSSDSWTRIAFAIHLLPAACRSMTHALGEVRFHTPLRGSAGIGHVAVPASLLNTSLHLDKAIYTFSDATISRLCHSVKLKFPAQISALQRAKDSIRSRAAMSALPRERAVVVRVNRCRSLMAAIWESSEEAAHLVLTLSD